MIDKIAIIIEAITGLGMVVQVVVLMRDIIIITIIILVAVGVPVGIINHLFKYKEGKKV